MPSQTQLLHSVLECAGTLHQISDRLEAISDATTMPFNQREQHQLARSVASVQRLLVTGQELLTLEVERWGL